MDRCKLKRQGAFLTVFEFTGTSQKQFSDSIVLLGGPKSVDSSQVFAKENSSNFNIRELLRYSPVLSLKDSKSA